MSYAIASPNSSVASSTTSTSVVSQSTTSNAAAETSQSTTNSPKPEPRDIALPVGLAVLLGVPIIALLAFIAFKKSKHKKAKSGDAGSSQTSKQPLADGKPVQPGSGELHGDNKQLGTTINVSSPPLAKPA